MDKEEHRERPLFSGNGEGSRQFPPWGAEDNFFFGKAILVNVRRGDVLLFGRREKVKAGDSLPFIQSDLSKEGHPLKPTEDGGHGVTVFPYGSPGFKKEEFPQIFFHVLPHFLEGSLRKKILHFLILHLIGFLVLSFLKKGKEKKRSLRTLTPGRSQGYHYKEKSHRKKNSTLHPLSFFLLVFQIGGQAPYLVTERR
jgi:hypothetical protein